MNLALHIFKKDVRHLRGLLAAWALLVVLQAGLGGSGLAASADNMAWEVAFGIIGMLVPMLQALLVFVLVPLLVHDEPLVGTTAFWFTRPIARTDLFKAKALFCGGLLVLAPLAVELAVLAANGATVRQLALAAPEILLGRLELLLMVAALAVLTSSFARFILWAALALVVFMVVSAVGYIVALFMNPAAVMRMAQEPSLMASRQIAAGVAGVVLSAAVVAHQYLRRRTAVSAGLWVASLALALALPPLWPFDFMRAAVDPAAATGYDAAGLEVALAGPRLTVSDHFRMSGKEGRRKNVRGEVRAGGGAPGYELRPRIAAAEFVFDDGFAARDAAEDFDLEQAAPDAAALERGLGGARLLNPPESRHVLRSLLSLKETDYDARRDRRGTLTATVEVGVYGYAEAGAVPLRARERIERGAEQAVITDVLREPGGCAVILRQRTLRLLFARKTPADRAFGAAAPDTVYVLRNRARGEALLPEDESGGDFGEMVNADRQLQIRSVRLRFGGGDAGRAVDEDWLAGAELVRLEARPVARATRELRAENVRLAGAFSYSADRRKSKAEVAAELDKIQFPENPTAESVREYIRAIGRASEGQSTRSSNDRQVGMLQRVGSAHVQLLFEEVPDSFYLSYAARPLFDESHRDWVVAHLREHPWLAEVVAKNGWTEAAREPLCRGVREQWENLPAEWLAAVAAFRDPTTYAGLVDLFAGRRGRAETYRALRDLAGIDLDAAVARAWRAARYDGEYETGQMIPIAIAHGHADALRAGILDVLNGSEEDYRSARRTVREAVKKHTGVEGSDAELAAWFRANEGRLVFDRDARRYRLKEP